MVDDARRLLGMLHPNPEDGFLELRLIQKDGPVHQTFIPASELDGRPSGEDLAGASSGDLYFGVALRDSRDGKKAAVSAVPALFADLDTEDAVAALGEFELAASTIISSGSRGHVHALWLLEEPIAPEFAERLLGAIAERLGGDPAVAHCNQVMRLPGTLNHKTDPPGPVKFVQTNGQRFQAQQFVDLLGVSAAKPAPRRQTPPSREGPPAVSPAVQGVLDLVEGVRAQGEGFMALCPAHDDTKPSLSIREGNGGSCQVHCFAECSRKEILAQLGLTPADLRGDDGHGDDRPLAALIDGLIHDAQVELFHDSLEQALARVPVAGHHEVWRVASGKFRKWLRYLLKTEHDRTAPAQALRDATELLAAMALFEGPEREVFVRVANVGDAVYLDLGDAAWRAAKVTAAGWEIVDHPEVAFVRRPSTRALPEPVHGGSVEDLRPFLNLGDERGWRLVLGFLVAALSGIGPFPILVLQGEQGSAKSTSAKMLRQLVDPVKAMLRAGSPDERDLMIAAVSQWLPGFDNVSKLQDQLADALCQLSTGAGYATRQLYSDDDEVIFEAMRPTIINGIAGISNRGDFLSRALLVNLPRIDDSDRLIETDMWAEFERARPNILGALLDLLAEVLAELPNVKLEEAPRLADFARIGTALERACGWPARSFIDALEDSQSGGLEDVLDAEPVAAVLQEFISKYLDWEGTMTKLLECLNVAADDEVKRQRGWPKNAAQLGVRMKRIAPALRKAGVEVEDAPAGRDKGKRRGVRIRQAPAPALGDARDDGDDGDSGGTPTRS